MKGPGPVQLAATPDAVGKGQRPMVELFPGAAQMYDAYRRQFGVTFSTRWLAYPEWQVLLPQALEKQCPVTDAAIQAYMAIARRHRRMP